MTRTMGDATHANVPALTHAAVQLVAGYVTGSPDVQWTAGDWALFPGVPHVTIDQGYTGSPVPDATVRDVETGAWGVGAAVTAKPWTPPRPTIYISVSGLPWLAATGWKGDIWVAWYNGNPALDFTVPPGMNCVAKQYTDTGGGGAYDLSAVFDPTWPATDPPPLRKDPDMATLVYGQNSVYLLDGGRAHRIHGTADLNGYLHAGLQVVGGPTQGGYLMTTEEEAQFLLDFPPGNPAVTVNIPPVTVTVPTLKVDGTIAPA
jgi:hypothetical protein